jgi:hypothetical protein
MAEPKDLQEAADAIHKVRSLAAVQRHKASQLIPSDRLTRNQTATVVIRSPKFICSRCGGLINAQKTGNERLLL